MYYSTNANYYWDSFENTYEICQMLVYVIFRLGDIIIFEFCRFRKHMKIILNIFK